MIAGVATKRPPPRPPRAPRPNDIALRLTGRDYISYSAISTYQRCPLRYFFGYIAGLPPEFKSSSLIFGGAIHRALEYHCCRTLEGAAPPLIDELVSVYERAWRDEAEVPVRFGKSESAESLKDLARRMLTAFCKSPFAELDGTILGIEEEFRVPVIPG